MFPRELNRNEWTAFFQMMAKATQGRQMLLELVGEDIGDQIEEDWQLFADSYFDEDTDTLYLRTAYVEHQIPRPQAVEIQEDNLLRAIAVKDADGVLQIIHFRDSLKLEPAQN